MNARTEANRWILGARPKTLPAAVVPVVVGTAIAADDVAINWCFFLCALVVALGMQIGVNYANDYSDGIRGTDEQRVGPVRLVASRLATPAEVKRAAFILFGIACLAGLCLALAVAQWLIIVGMACVLGAWFYTGGKRPYGYEGLGELAVFIFFGLVATCGSAFVQTERITATAVLAAIAVGSISVALLVVNNLRDRQNDALAGKRTLAVRLGDHKTRRLYQAAIGLPFLCVIVIATTQHRLALLVALAAPLALDVIKRIDRGASGRELIGVLQRTARYQLLFGALFAVGLCW